MEDENLNLKTKMTELEEKINSLEKEIYLSGIKQSANSGVSTCKCKDTTIVDLNK